MAETLTKPGASLQLLEARLGAKQAASKTFDPTIIIAIITALLPLITNCFKPTPANLRRRFGNRARLAWAIHAQMPELSMVDCFAHADEVFEVADEANDDEIRAFVTDCRS